MTMRLTLRTMLAYKDKILEPAEDKEMSSKIQESEFAGTLLKRIEDVVGKNTLGAPAVSGAQVGIDPNRVAEYLDNVMPLDQVEEFEKTCLQTDTFLAELSSCHQVLVLILGEPASVDPKARERMYTLIDESKASAPAADAKKTDGAKKPAEKPAAAAASSGAAAPAADGTKPEIPDYLREDQGFGWALPAAAVILVAALIGVFMVANPFGKSKDVAKNEQPVTPADNTPQDDPKDDTDKTKTNGTDTNGTDTKGTDTKGTDTNGTDTNGTDTKTVSPPPVPKDDTPAKKEPDPKDDTPPKKEPDPKDDTPPKKEPDPKDDAPPKKEPDPKDDSTPVVGRKVEMGQFAMAGADEVRPVLLYYNSEEGNWQRLRPQSLVVSGNRLITLPTFRSTIILNEGIKLEMLGGTTLELEAPSDGVPWIRVLSGRIVATSSKDNVGLGLRIGKTSVKVMFTGGAESIAGFEVHPHRVVGADPLSAKDSPVTIEASFYLASGAVSFDDGTTNVAVDAPPAHGTLMPLKLVGAVEADWIRSRIISPLDDRAQPLVEEGIQPGAFAPLKLEELVDHRRAEVSLLALRCLAYVGRFEPLVKSLNNPEMWRPTSRDAVIAQLIEAIQHGPQTAALVREPFVKIRGDRADDLWRMLWGYTRVQLEQGQAAQLVSYLDHDDLDFRVLAFYNLKEITGLNLNYRPEMSKTERASAIGRWQQRLEAGGIVPK